MILFKGRLTNTTYFYSDEIFIDPSYFKGHNYGNWYQYLEETNALPLKIITKNNFLHMEITAIKIIFTEVDDSEFIVE